MMNTGRKVWQANFGWVTVPDSREWDPPNLRGWVHKAVILYPQIVRALLIGSRGSEQGAMVKDDSDYDVVILLDSECYTSPINGRQLEQTLTFDNRLKCHGLDVLASGEHDLDVYFLRPSGQIASWNFPPGKTVPQLWYFDLASETLDLARKAMWEHGLVHWTDKGPFYASLPNAPRLFVRPDHDLDPTRQRLLNP